MMSVSVCVCGGSFSLFVFHSKPIKQKNIYTRTKKMQGSVQFFSPSFVLNVSFSRASEKRGLRNEKQKGRRKKREKVDGGYVQRCECVS